MTASLGKVVIRMKLLLESCKLGYVKSIIPPGFKCFWQICNLEGTRVLLHKNKVFFKLI